MTKTLTPLSTASRAALATLLGLVLGMLTWAVTPSDGPAAAGPTMQSCGSPAVDAVPSNREVNLLVDEENSQITFTYLDDAAGEDRAVTVDYATDPSCKNHPVVGPKIRDARTTAKEVRTQQCTGMRGLLTAKGAAAEHRGKRVNPAAVKHYLTEICEAR